MISLPPRDLNAARFGIDRIHQRAELLVARPRRPCRSRSSSNPSSHRRGRSTCRTRRESGTAADRRPARVQVSSLPGGMPGKISCFVRGFTAGRVDLPGGFDLRRRQARLALGARAQQRARIEAAGRGFSIRPSVAPSRASHAASARLVEQRQLGGRQVRRRILERRSGRQQRSRHQVRPEVGGRAGDDAVVVVRKALRLHQALPSAGRAADEIRQARPVAVEGRDDRLGLDGHLVDRAIAEVDHELGMAERPRPPGVEWPVSVDAVA